MSVAPSDRVEVLPGFFVPSFGMNTPIVTSQLSGCCMHWHQPSCTQYCKRFKLFGYCTNENCLGTRLALSKSWTWENNLVLSFAVHSCLVWPPGSGLVPSLCWCGQECQGLWWLPGWGESHWTHHQTTLSTTIIVSRRYQTLVLFGTITNAVLYAPNSLIFSWCQFPLSH